MQVFHSSSTPLLDLQLLHQCGVTTEEIRKGLEPFIAAIDAEEGKPSKIPDWVVGKCDRQFTLHVSEKIKVQLAISHKENKTEKSYTIINKQNNYSCKVSEKAFDSLKNGIYRTNYQVGEELSSPEILCRTLGIGKQVELDKETQQACSMRRFNEKQTQRKTQDDQTLREIGYTASAIAERIEALIERAKSQLQPQMKVPNRYPMGETIVGDTFKIELTGAFEETECPLCEPSLVFIGPMCGRIENLKSGEAISFSEPVLHCMRAHNYLTMRSDRIEPQLAVRVLEAVPSSAVAGHRKSEHFF